MLDAKSIFKTKSKLWHETIIVRDRVQKIGTRKEFFKSLSTNMISLGQFFHL